MFSFFETMHGALLDHFYGHQVIWWGALALATAGAIVLGYVTSKHDAKAGNR